MTDTTPGHVPRELKAVFGSDSPEPAADMDGIFEEIYYALKKVEGASGQADSEGEEIEGFASTLEWAANNHPIVSYPLKSFLRHLAGHIKENSPRYSKNADQ